MIIYKSITDHKPKHKYNIRISVPQGSTFQLIVVSDGLHTYAMFIYGYTQMTWTTDVVLPDIWIGYATGREPFYSNIFSFTKQALRMDLHAVTNGTMFLIILFDCWLPQQEVSL